MPDFNVDCVVEGCGRESVDNHGYCKRHKREILDDNPITTGRLEYDPTLEVPNEIIEAANKIGEWTTRQGWKNWKIGPVADRAAERESDVEPARTIRELRQQLATERQRIKELELICKTKH